MSAGLFILWMMLASVLALIVATLALPLRLELRAQFGPALRWTAAVRPLGRFGPRIPIGPGKVGKPRSTREKPRKSAKPSRGQGDPQRLFKSAIRLFRDVMPLVHVRALSLHLRFGCDDPSDTGALYGAFTPIMFGVSGSRRADIRVEPVFDRAVFTGQAALDASVTPARLLPVLARFGWAEFGPGQ